MELLKKLISTSGVSGNEEAIRAMIQEGIRRDVDNVFIDNIGNLIAHKKGESPAVMLVAHMDEVGLIIKRITNEGKMFFSTVGGLKPQVLIGQKVEIFSKKGNVRGVITTKEISNSEYGEYAPRIDNMFVDTGLDREELTKAGVEIGSFIGFAQTQEITLGSDDIICGKALDDRIGCYILLELAKLLKNNKNEIYYVFTVQEEVGLYGSKASTYHIKPDWAIAVDVTEADDCETNSPTKRIGYGPTITVKDADMIGNKCINNWLKNIATAKNIPIQLDVSDTGTTDALSISLSRDGVPSSVVGVAVRNLHSRIGMASKKDIEYAIKLLEELMKRPPKQCTV